MRFWFLLDGDLPRAFVQRLLTLESLLIETSLLIPHGSFFWQDGVEQPDAAYVNAVQDFYIDKHESLSSTDSATAKRVLGAIAREIRAAAPDCFIIVDGIQHAAHGRVDIDDYDIVYLAGGWGAAFDLGFSNIQYEGMDPDHPYTRRDIGGFGKISTSPLPGSRRSKWDRETRSQRRSPPLHQARTPA